MKLVASMFLFGLVGLTACVTTVATPTPDIPATVSAALEDILSTTSQLPTPIPPDIEATVEARVSATIAAIPTPTAPPPPTAVPTLIPTLTPTPTQQPTTTPIPTITPVPTLRPTSIPSPTPEGLALYQVRQRARDGQRMSNENLSGLDLSGIPDERARPVWGQFVK